MDIVITQWALDSYLNLVGGNIITRADYWTIIRPDVELLKTMSDPKFQNHGFWGPAKVGSNIVSRSYKMKWHNIGNGGVQLRLGVVLLHGKTYLCNAFVKSSTFVDRRECAKLCNYADDIARNLHIERGTL